MESKIADAKAIIGLTDLSARKITNRQLGRDILSFQFPLKMYIEMEDNVQGSFLERDTWADIIDD